MKLPKKKGPLKEKVAGKNKKKMTVRLGNSIRKDDPDGKKGITYNTNLIDRLSKNISFESLDISSNFSIHEDTAFAKEGYIRVFNIVKYPLEIMYTDEKGFLSAILNSLKTVKGLEQDVDFFYEGYNKPYSIRFDQATKRRYAGLERQERSIREKIAENSNNRQSARDKEIKQMANDALEFRLTEVIKKKNSYNIIRGNQNRGSTQVESFQFIRLVTKKKSLLKVAEEQLISRLSSVDIQIRKVKDLSAYFETFSPVSGLYGLNKNNDYASTIFTSTGYSKIRNKPTRILENELEGLSRLVLMGTDIDSFEPLGLTFTSSGQGQNMVIVGTTGSGKTYLYENIMQNARLNNFKLNAMDYKGNEYKAVAEVIPNSITLDFSLNSPYFINTLKFIPELYDKKDWQREFAYNLEATVTSLRILAGVSAHNAKTASNALEEMIKNIYAQKYRVFFDDIESYYGTRNVDYFIDIGEALSKFQSDKELKGIYGEEVCREIYSGLQPYFSTMSHRSYMFSEEIDLEQVLNKDCIIYSFNTNKETNWDTLMEYKIFNLDYISNLFIQKNKREGFTTLNSLEEYQRAVNSPDMRRIYNNKLSGGRSDNVINVVLTNTIQPLLEKSNDISAMRENISTIIVGRLQDMGALDDFCRVYGLGDRGRDQIIRAGRYQHVFYIKYNTGVQRGERLIKAIHPEYISKYFETKRIDTGDEMG